MKLIAVLNSKKRPHLLGFAISLLGALPLGYTNVISLQILLEQGNWASLSFILGIIFVQYFVLKTVYKISSWLIKQKKLLLFIELFTILFLLVIGVYFMYSSTKHQNISLSNLILIQYPFLLAVFLNLLNFIQWPYWSGIYIYLFRTDKLDNQIKTRNKFIVGALLGTSVGMFLFAHVGQFLLMRNQIKISSYINTIFMILFLFLAFVQTAKFIFKNTFDRKEINEL